MAKQQASPRYIFKIHSSRLRKAKWDLALPLSEARRNDEIVSLNDSQMLRWIDELNGVVDQEEKVAAIKSRMRAVKKEPSSVRTKREIRQLYAQLDELQFKPDYMCLVIDKEKDMHRACRGFKVNGINYVRLLGTNGGVKMSTIVFVSERLASTLRERIDNGRDVDVPQIPAKLEAYRALTCSGSIPVSMPNGILLVPDCETTFKEDVITLNDENSVEPEMQFVKDYEITLDESDGYGLICPALAERWSAELGLDYVASAMNTRFSWEKGCVFTFDFHEFADKVAGSYMVKDAWGNEVDIRNVELVLTTSMLKLWKCYRSMEHYLECCAENHYTFGIPKVAPKELENRRNLNYQFIQSYNLTDEDIDELIKPTIDEIWDVISGDYRKAILFLRGVDLKEDDTSVDMADIASALMIEPEIYNDPYIRGYIYRMIKKRIVDAKIGVISVEGNYSIIGGDPFALCQSIFGLPVTGLLKAGEIYNQYWKDKGAECVACFRAPMTCHNNIRKTKICYDADASYWYRFITTCTLINAWDSCAAAWNGADKDGDIIFISSNRVLVDNIRPLPTIFCAQRSGVKIEVTEHDLVTANILSFGDDIGRTTNYITSMFDVQANFQVGSLEYDTLEYRIACGQLFQQAAIDKVKGIIAKPMPRYWYDRHQSVIPDGVDSDLCKRIVADKKPYFMRYIYPTLKKQYDTYVKNAKVKCLREFRIELDELLSKPKEDLTDEQENFLYFYNSRMPVSVNNGVMNRICRKVERAFDGKLMMRITEDIFDYSILKSGSEYTRTQYCAIEGLFDIHKRAIRDYIFAEKSYCDQEVINLYRHTVMRVFQEGCYRVCTNGGQLCDMIIDMCYTKSGTKKFAWTVCPEEIMENLLERNNRVVSFPVADPDGDIHYAGGRFKMVSKVV